MKKRKIFFKWEKCSQCGRWVKQSEMLYKQGRKGVLKFDIAYCKNCHQDLFKHKK